MATRDLIIFALVINFFMHSIFSVKLHHSYLTLYLSMHGWMSLTFATITQRGGHKSIKAKHVDHPLVLVSWETNIVSILKGVSARRRLLYKTSYKNILLEISQILLYPYPYPSCYLIDLPLAK